MRIITRARGLLTSLLLLSAIGSADEQATPTLDSSSFNCVDAFDVIALATMLHCQIAGAQPDTDQLIPAAVDRLRASGDSQERALDDVTIEWCPLTHALGFTASGQHIYLDAGLRVGTVDLVAEVLAHELVHVRQFRALGTDGFKCAYVQAFIDCGACQDEGNRFESEAYVVQEQVRTDLRERSLQRRE
ncbi:MAG: hypothetical protein O3C28_11720 [Proteobacteria bacterium]|nr:hypothetical protein [Pseudomonadota bacterium]